MRGKGREQRLPTSRGQWGRPPEAFRGEGLLLEAGWDARTTQWRQSGGKELRLFRLPVEPSVFRSCRATLLGLARWSRPPPRPPGPVACSYVLICRAPPAPGTAARCGRPPPGRPRGRPGSSAPGWRGRLCAGSCATSSSLRNGNRPNPPFRSGSLAAPRFVRKTNVVRLWDPRQWDRDGAQLKGHTDNVRARALSASGKLLLSGSSDNTIRLWDLGQQPAWMRVFLLQVYSCSKPRV